MKPYYEHAGITIWHGDCREILSELRGESLIVDPPFGINWGRASWDDDIAAYPALIKWLVRTSIITVPSGWCFCFQAMPNCSNFHEWFPVGWRIFAACKNFAQIRPTGIWHSWDPVIFWSNGAMPRRNAESVNRDYFVGNVAGVFGDKNDHPCPRPLDTMKHIVDISTPINGMVIDPFMGSGTTLKAAKDTGRRAIGIEIEERYCEIAAKRLSQEVLDFRA